MVPRPAAGPDSPAPRIYVLHVARVKDRFAGQLELLQELAAEWRPRVVGIEAVAYQRVLCQSAADHGLPVQELPAGGHKAARIENASVAAARGWLYLPQGKRWAGLLRQEALDYPGARHDDQLDALARALECGLPLLERSRLARRGLPDGALSVLSATADLEKLAA